MVRCWKMHRVFLGYLDGDVNESFLDIYLVDTLPGAVIQTQASCFTDQYGGT